MLMINTSPIRRLFQAPFPYESVLRPIRAAGEPGYFPRRAVVRMSSIEGVYAACCRHELRFADNYFFVFFFDITPAARRYARRLPVY